MKSLYYEKYGHNKDISLVISRVFSFLNKKKESIIDPKFNTDYDCGEFINVINLKKIKDKEEEKEEDFQAFLESYYTLRQSMNKKSSDINKLKLETIRIKNMDRKIQS